LNHFLVYTPVPSFLRKARRGREGGGKKEGRRKEEGGKKEGRGGKGKEKGGDCLGTYHMLPIICPITKPVIEYSGASKKGEPGIQ
jgi:hypothetical protein